MDWERVMKNNWQTKKLGEVCEVVNGGTPKTNIEQYWDGDILWITPKDMGRLNGIYVADTERKISKKGLKNSSAKIIQSNSIILSTRAPIGYLAINKKEITTNQGCKGIIPKKELDVHFLFYFLKHSSDLLQKLGSGTTFKELSSTKLAEIEIPLPPLPTQRRIVKKLDKIFAGIEMAGRNAEKNLQNARELFESYLQGVFANPSTMLGTGPGEGWELVKLSELATDITDGDHLPPPKSPTGIPFITISNIDKNNYKIDFSKTFTVPKEYYKRLKVNRKPKKGDVLYTVTGSFGIPVIVDSDLKFCFQRHIGLVRPTKYTNTKWLYYLLLSPRVFKQAYEGATGTAQKTVSLKTLRNLMVPKMSLPTQRAIVKKLDALAGETKKLEAIYQKKLTDLDELKKTVLKKAFAGEL